VSIRQQRRVEFDALLYNKYPRDYRHCAGDAFACAQEPRGRARDDRYVRVDSAGVRVLAADGRFPLQRAVPVTAHERGTLVVPPRHSNFYWSTRVETRGSRASSNRAKTQQRLCVRTMGAAASCCGALHTANAGIEEIVMSTWKEARRARSDNGALRPAVSHARTKVLLTIAAAAVGGAALLALPVSGTEEAADDQRIADKSHVGAFDGQILVNVGRAFWRGREIFRGDTFGDEAFWGDALKLHEAVQGERFGGVGPGLTPRAALALGLKVDAAALPLRLRNDLERGRVNLDDPAVTLALLRLDAVVGVKGFFGGDRLRSMGITCALCHSTVDNSLATGIGHRLDGWANRDLDVGQIIALAPDLTPLTTLLGLTPDAVRRVLRSWGPGKFDAEPVLDGKAVNPNTGRSSATLIPPSLGLAGVNLHTWTGWGSVTHWNAFVSNLEMHGKGTFFDPRLDNAAKFPIAAANGFGHVRSSPDLITSKLGDLHFYQIAIPAPRPPAGSFDADAAKRGEAVFAGKAQCATCHVPPLFTEPGWNMHTPAEVGIDDFQAKRSPDERYRTAPLKGLWAHQKGGFYHDGRFATLADVIEHYNRVKRLGLNAQEKADLAQYLLSL
jgi:hypothetical protein